MVWKSMHLKHQFSSTRQCLAMILYTSISNLWSPGRIITSLLSKIGSFRTLQRYSITRLTGLIASQTSKIISSNLILILNYEYQLIETSITTGQAQSQSTNKCSSLLCLRTSYIRSNSCKTKTTSTPTNKIKMKYQTCLLSSRTKATWLHAIKGVCRTAKDKCILVLISSQRCTNVLRLKIHTLRWALSPIVQKGVTTLTAWSTSHRSSKAHQTFSNILLTIWSSHMPTIIQIY